MLSILAFFVLNIIIFVDNGRELNSPYGKRLKYYQRVISFQFIILSFPPEIIKVAVA